MKHAGCWILSFALLSGCKFQSKTETPPPGPATTSGAKSMLENSPAMTLWLKPENYEPCIWKDPRNGFTLQGSTDSCPVKKDGAVSFDGLNDKLISTFFLNDVVESNGAHIAIRFRAHSISTQHHNPWQNNPLLIDEKGRFGLTLKSDPVALVFNYIQRNSQIETPILLNEIQLIHLNFDGKEITTGQNQGKLKAASEPIQNLSSKILLGGSDLGTDFFDGEIFEVVIFNKALSDSETMNLQSELKSHDK